MLGQGQTIQEFQHRYPWLFYSIAFALSLLSCRLVYLQLYRGSFYRRFSEKNSLRKEKMPGPRGLVFDRNYKLLVDNRLQMDVTLTPQFAGEGEQVIQKLAEISGEPYDRLLSRFQEKKKGQPKFQPVTVLEDAAWPVIVKIESSKRLLQGVEVETRIRRTYLQGETGAHLFGYLSEVTKNDIDANLKRGAYYELGDWIGRAGLERKWEKYLRGHDGQRFVVVNAHGHRVAQSASDIAFTGALKRDIPTQSGYNLVLTIDADLQEAAVAGMRGKMGAVVALDPRTGEVLAMISQPSYDPTELTSKGAELWQSFTKNRWGPLRNKGVMDHFPPGSIFKPFVALAGLEAGVIDENTTVNCTGGMRFGNRVYHCHKTHGLVNLNKAISGSCDIFFYQLATRLGVDPISRMGMNYGFGAKTGIELLNEASGLMPTEAWKQQTFNQPWTPGENLSTSIGQGYNLVTPLQMANAYSALVNGGNLYQPYLISRVELQDGKVVQQFGPKVLRTHRVDPKFIKVIKQGLYDVANLPGATAYTAMHMKGNLVSGKTGTVQTYTQTKEELKRPCYTHSFDKRDHGWFMGYAPSDNPEIVVAVFGMHECSGSKGAAPVARVIFEKWWEKKQAEAALRGPQPAAR